VITGLFVRPGVCLGRPPMSSSFSLLLASVLLTALVPRVASADQRSPPPGPLEKPDDPPPHQPRRTLSPQRFEHFAAPVVVVPPDTSFETPLALGQALAGAAVPYIAATVVLRSGSEGSVVIAAAGLSPLLVGAVVCGIGNASARYQGSCLPSIVGGTLGALTTVPLFYLGRARRDPRDDLDLGGIFLGVVGWFVIQPMAAVVAWHLFRHPRAGLRAPTINPAAPPAAFLRGSPPERSAGLAGAPGQLMVRVLSLGF
jgi:hypothetical protein